jgi:hypothetical protein
MQLKRSVEGRGNRGKEYKDDEIGRAGERASERAREGERGGGGGGI